MLNKLSTRIVLSAVAIMFTASAQASLLFSSDFAGNSVSGTQMTDISWYQDGVMGLGNLNVEEETAPAGAPALSFFNTTASANRFAVDRNLHNEGSWFVDFAFSVDSTLAYIAADSFSLDALIFNNSGQIQNYQRQLSMTFELFDNGMNLLASENFLQIFVDAQSGYSGPERAVSMSLGGKKLKGGESYLFRVTAFGDGIGNNAGIDNVAFEGTKVPEPAALGLFGLSLLMMRKFRKS